MKQIIPQFVPQIYPQDKYGKQLEPRNLANKATMQEAGAALQEQLFVEFDKGNINSFGRIEIVYGVADIPDSKLILPDKPGLQVVK